MIRLAAIGILACLAAPAAGAELLPFIKGPQDPALFVQRNNELRAAINSNFLLNDGTNVDVTATRDSLGLGTADNVIFNRLGVGGTTVADVPVQDGDSWGSAASQDPRIVIARHATTALNAHAFRDYSEFIGTGSASSYNSFDAFATITSAGTDVTTHYAGFQARPNINTGTTGITGADLPRAIMFQAIPLLAVGTTVDNYWGFYSAPNNTQGTVTDARAFYARSMNTVSNPTWATTAHAFYADSDPSFFGGATDIGTASYASGLVPLSVMNTGHQRLLNVGTAVGGGGAYIAGLASTGAASGRPTVDDAQILLDRSTAASGGGIEFIVSGASNGSGFKLAAPNVASGTAGTRTGDMLLFGRSNNVAWTEIMRFAPNLGTAGIGNSLMAANLSIAETAGTFRVYNAVTNATDTEFFQASWSGGVLGLGTNVSGAGTARSMALMTGGTAAVTISTAQVLTLNAATYASCTSLKTVAGVLTCVP